MPSIRKRIGYLPSINIQEIITQIANKEKLSQSKIVGILVEEALTARGVFDTQNTNHLSNKIRYRRETNINNLTFKHGDLDELISDKGITYNTKNHKHNSDDVKTNNREKYDEELVELFRQFTQFQKMLKENK